MTGLLSPVGRYHGGGVTYSAFLTDGCSETDFDCVVLVNRRCFRKYALSALSQMIYRSKLCLYRCKYRPARTQLTLLQMFSGICDLPIMLSRHGSLPTKYIALVLGGPMTKSDTVILKISKVTESIPFGLRCMLNADGTSSFFGWNISKHRKRNALKPHNTPQRGRKHYNTFMTSHHAPFSSVSKPGAIRGKHQKGSVLAGVWAPLPVAAVGG